MMNANRILIVDDTPSIHEDFRKILSTQGTMGKDLDDMAESLFGSHEPEPVLSGIDYELDSAFQGEEAISMIEQAENEGEAYSLVFMDVRMPPGLDGIKTIEKIWQRYPSMEVVICTAYSDYSWIDIVDILGPADNLLVLKKPFDADEAQQMALSLTRRASNSKKQGERISSLEDDLESCHFTVNRLKQQIEKSV